MHADGKSTLASVSVEFGKSQFWDVDIRFDVNFAIQNEFDKNKGVLCHFSVNLFDLYPLKVLPW